MSAGWSAATPVRWLAATRRASSPARGTEWAAWPAGTSPREPSARAIRPRVCRGNASVGGLVGEHDGALTAGYATGRVSGSSRVGGLVGRNQSTGSILASYAPAYVSGTSDAGGLAGTGTGTASYWDTSTSGRTVGAAGRTTAALQSPTGYTGIYSQWNVDLDGDSTVDDPWHFGTTAQYPALAVDVNGAGGATWQELGYQLRGGPSLTLTADGRPVDPQMLRYVRDRWSNTRRYKRSARSGPALVPVLAVLRPLRPRRKTYRGRGAESTWPTAKRQAGRLQRCSRRRGRSATAIGSCSRCGAGRQSPRRRCPGCSSPTGAPLWRIVAHGFRSAFRGWAEEETYHPREASRRWPTWCRKRLKSPTPRRTSSSGGAGSWTTIVVPRGRGSVMLPAAIRIAE